MSLEGIIIAAVVVAGAGIIIGVLLGLADKTFKVEVDEKEILIREALPGSNCGGCGYAGCDALAKAMAQGIASPAACPVGGESVAQTIAEITGGSADVEKNVAFVMCDGTCTNAKERYEYSGNLSCREAHYVTGSGSKACTYGCLGYGSCVKVCEFDAIHIVDGIAVADKEKCTACGQCITECPKDIIELVPYEARTLVQCFSKDKGKDVRPICSVGCIACKICEKACQYDAIHVVDNIARIDYDKCVNCRACVEKCPTKIILEQEF